MNEIIKTATQFDFNENIISLSSYGCGHINTTYLIQTDSENNYILQKINTDVFTSPEKLMQNIQNVTDYILNEIKNQPDAYRSVLSIIPTKNGDLIFTNKLGTWRMMKFIPDSITLETIENPEYFYRAGKAFGHFSYLLNKFPIETLHETIKNFHNTPSRYNDFEDSIKRNLSGRASKVSKEIEFVRQRKDFCSLFTSKIQSGELPLRVTHNDTKLNNVLFDKTTLQPLAVIDLDTVMPGLSLYDFGDAIRYGANTAAEDETDISTVSCDLRLFEAFTSGYMEQFGMLLTDAEIEMLPFAAKMMTFECGMRFLADYINGDIYFKTQHENHNLDRCRNQFALVKDLEKKESELIKIVKRHSQNLSSAINEKI